MRGSTVMSRMCGKQAVVTCFAVASESAFVRTDNRSSSDRKCSRGIFSEGSRIESVTKNRYLWPKGEEGGLKLRVSIRWLWEQECLILISSKPNRIQKPLKQHWLPLVLCTTSPSCFISFSWCLCRVSSLDISLSPWSSLTLLKLFLPNRDMTRGSSHVTMSSCWGDRVTQRDTNEI